MPPREGSTSSSRPSVSSKRVKSEQPALAPEVEQERSDENPDLQWAKGNRKLNKKLSIAWPS